MSLPGEDRFARGFRRHAADWIRPHPRGPTREGRLAMHYPHVWSNRARKRRIGFRARMKTKGGRKLINRQRRIGRSLNRA